MDSPLILADSPPSIETRFIDPLLNIVNHHRFLHLIFWTWLVYYFRLIFFHVLADCVLSYLPPWGLRSRLLVRSG